MPKPIIDCCHQEINCDGCGITLNYVYPVYVLENGKAVCENCWDDYARSREADLYNFEFGEDYEP